MTSKFDPVELLRQALSAPPTEREMQIIADAERELAQAMAFWKKYQQRYPLVTSEEFTELADPNSFHTMMLHEARKQTRLLEEIRALLDRTPEAK